MNKLSTEKRAQIIGMMVEGPSMRAITRLTGTSLNTIAKLLTDAADAAAAYHGSGARHTVAGISSATKYGIYAKEAPSVRRLRRRRLATHGR